jgi:Wiskott-Aldrich syndrome protein
LYVKGSFHFQSARSYFSQRSKKGEKRKLKKEDISLPTNFQHISHVGWDPNRGFDLENVDPKLKQFFSRAGVSERELQDKDTRDFIYEFLERHGGMEAALLEEERRKKSAAAAPVVQQLGNCPCFLTAWLHFFNVIGLD